MNIFKILFLCLFCSLFWSKAQNVQQDSVSADFNCGIIQTKQKLDGKFFASTPTLDLRVNNEEHTYSVLQFGKRNNHIFLHMRILADNVCIKKDKNIDILFKNGEIITLRNEYPLNCDGVFVRQLDKKESDKIKNNAIALIKIYTYHKNYEHYISEENNYTLKNQLECLSAYKIRKTD